MKALLSFGHQFGNPYLYISCGCHKYIESSIFIVVFVCLELWSSSKRSKQSISRHYPQQVRQQGMQE